MSIKKNFFYSSILTVANYLFPLITFPYVLRVLGATNVGKYNFVDSIISYFILFSTMGVGIIGVREIARSKIFENKEVLSKTFSSLFLLNALFTLCSLIIFLLYIFLYSNLQDYDELLYIGGAKILFTLFLIEWFYRGIENFQYITVRSIIIKVIYVFLVFFLVTKQDDYVTYYLLTVGMVLFNGTLNILYSRKFIDISFTGLQLKKYLAPLLKTGFYTLLTSMYTTFNVVYLGFVCSEEEVGYYATAIKLYVIVLAVFTAFTGVIMPRVSALIEEKKIDDIILILDKSFGALFLFCFPIVVITVALAPQIIFMVGGLEYENAILPMRIVMPLILVVGMAQVFVMQILMPFKHDNYVLYSATIGAIVGLLLNILLVKELASIGSAIVILISEITVLISAIYFSRTILVLKFPFKRIFINALLSIPYLFICLICQFYIDSTFLILLVSATFSFLYFFISQIFIMRNEIFINFFNVILYRIKKR